ncbi:MAG TPA: hypothetical protein VMW27_09010, partial [Thermoanaerobaculia bacterium]|nr:hypothetical protein [Thermoanaerobaculia bacterium]
VVAPPGYPIGQPAFSLKPGESVDVLDIFPNDSESGYTCKIRNNSGRIGFLICDNIRMLEWRGDRGSLVRMLVDEPYEYESSYLDRKELIEKLDAYIAKNPSGRFVPFAELEIISAKCNVAMDAMQNVWTEVRGIREQEVGVRIGTRINPRWSPEASQLYTALAKQEPEVLQGLLDLCKLVGKLQSLVPSPISLAEEQ